MVDDELLREQDPATNDEATAAIWDVREEMAALDAKLGKAIAFARWRGASWSAIGDALGVSKQAAHQQWQNVEERKRLGEFD